MKEEMSKDKKFIGCVFCGNEVKGKRWAKYCSQSCISKAYEKRHKIERSIRSKNYAVTFRKKNKDRLRGLSKERYQKDKKVITVRSITRTNFQKEDKCGICQSPNHLEFHHWIYEQPVEKKHFSTLCHNCHKIQHNKEVVII